MSNEYAAAVGVWDHTIGEVTHRIEPDEEDNYVFLKIKNKAEKNEDSSILFRGVGDLYFDMVMRSNPLFDESKKKDLKRWISKNINKIIEIMHFQKGLMNVLLQILV